MDKLIQQLTVILANTYALYLKTQNYHWHVRGIEFRSLHKLFESQYQDLAEAIDALAERIVILGHHAPASFRVLNALKTIEDGNALHSAHQMLSELAADHMVLIRDLREVMGLASKVHDEGSIVLLSERVAAHEKMAWMLKASSE